MSSEELCKFVVEGMQEKKALNIVTMDLRAVENAIADFFVICTGSSDTHIDAICDSVEDTVLKQTSNQPWHLEGKSNKEWILLDYIEVVVHIFNADRREYYAIEELWADAQSTYV